MTQLPPSEGERRALRGYVPQYVIASKLVIDSLRVGEFEWIRLVDPLAGRLDDIQIATRNRVDAYQIKWSRYESAFTFQQWTQSGSPTLLEQLVDGWQRLRQLYTNRNVVVHLLSNDYPSVNDSLPVSGGPVESHFAAFMRTGWSTRQYDSWMNSPQWQQTWNELQQKCNLRPMEFQDFIRSCELDLKYTYPLVESAVTSQGQKEQEELRELCVYLMEQVAGSSSQQPIQIARRDLINNLGWTAKYEYRNRHLFPVDENHYIPIQETIDELTLKLTAIKSGYLAVVGSAGSGKSSLLSKTLELRPERVISYFAYIPDEENSGYGRGESLNFLADVNLTIRNQGISIPASPAHDRQEALRQFYDNLDLLNRRWKETGIRTLLLIDGLDHIPREQSPANSLLSDLPLPNRIPEGVCIILGTRSDQLPGLASDIQRQISEPSNRVEMRPLNREAVMEIIAQYDLSVQLSDEDRERIYDLSEGHPLALDYILRRLQNRTSKSAKEILDNVPVYDGDIQNEYEQHWGRFVNQKPELKKLLGLISRIRRPIDIDWLEKQFSQEVLSFVENFHYYFKQVNRQIWLFHHSSYRVFLERKTVTTVSGSYDIQQAKEFHQQLADRFASLPPKHLYEWERLYHYVRAGNISKVVELATADYFRTQLLSFRPIVSIQADIAHTLRLAADIEDPVLLTRLLLASAELEQRKFYLDVSWLAQALLQLTEPGIASTHIRQGQALIVDAAKALEFTAELWRSGFVEESRFIFSLAEPINKLKSKAPISSRDDIDGAVTGLLRKWVSVAVYFRPLDQILDWLRNLQCEVDPHSKLNATEATHVLHAQLLYDLGAILLDNGRMEEFEQVLGALDLNVRNEAFVCFWLQHAFCTELAQNHREQHQSRFSQLLTFAHQIDLSNEMNLALAEYAYRALKDERLCHEYLDSIPQPPLRSDLVSTNAGLDPFDMRFRLNRLLFALGNRKSLSELVPDAARESDQGVAYFERGICVIAHIWAKAWINIPFTPFNIQSDLKDWIQFYYRKPSNEWTTWYMVRGAQGAFFELMIDAVAQHGTEVLRALWDYITEEWQSAPVNCWPLDVKRTIILAFIHHGLPIRNWAIEKLNEIAAHMYQNEDISGRVDACKAQFEALMTIGEQQRAEHLLQDLLLNSFGVGYRKDYQLNSWIQWLPRINAVEPQTAVERIKRFSEVLITLDETTEGRASYLAARELVAVAYKYNPSLSLILFRLFIQHQILTHESGITEILREYADSPTASSQWIAQVFGAFLLRFCDQEDLESDIEITLLTTLKRLPRDVQQNVIKFLLVCIATYAMPSQRPIWRHILSKLTRDVGLPQETVGLSQSDLEFSDPRFTAEYLRLKDGSQIAVQKLNGLVDKPATLQQFLRDEAENSYFDWSPILSRILTQFTIDNIRETVQVILEIDAQPYRKGKLLVRLAYRLYELNELQAAWELGIQCLEYAEDRGWYPFYSTTRIEAFSLLVKINAQKARPLAWDDFRKNTIYSEPHDSLNLATNLDKILDVLCVQVPIAQIWHEIELYVRILTPQNSDVTPIRFDLISPADVSTENVLCHLILDYIGHPIQIVATAAAKVCGEMIIQHDLAIIDTIRERFNGSDDIFQMHLISVLHAVALHKPNMVANFEEILSKMSGSPNLLIRYASKEVANLAGLSTHTDQVPTSLLPAIYQLAIPGERPLLYDREIPLGSVLSDSQFASEILRLYKVEILALSRMSGFPVENIRARVIQIMNNLEHVTPWKAKDEESLRTSLHNTGLRLAYVRPRHRAAKIAIFKAMGELYDAGEISDAQVKEASNLLNFYDPRFVLEVPEVRPIDVAPIEIDENSKLYIKADWVKQITDNDIGKIAPRIEDCIVLGELTELGVVSDGNPVEIRRSQIRVFDPDVEANLGDPDHFFECVIQEHSSQCEALIPHSEDSSCVIRHFDHGYISQCGEWLAFNPFIAHKLGWKLSSEGLFRWVNQDGEIMVESHWWMDSTLNHRDRLSEEVGDGWLVVASPTGWANLHNSYPYLVRDTMIERHYFIEGLLTRNYRLGEKQLFDSSNAK